MDIEKLKLEAQNKALHIADVSGSTFVNADCFDVFPFIEDKSIDAIICDLPYGTTRNKWNAE
jgi:tRNA G10  N-methylase Trm11